MKWMTAALGVLLATGAAFADREFEYPATGKITGKRYYCGSGRPHTGGPSLDISADCYRCIYASRGGTAYYNGGCGSSCSSYGGGKDCNGGAGNYISIYHNNGYKSRYLHGLAGTQRTGSVTDSQRILKMGATGLAGGVHVHFDLWRNGTKLAAWLDSVPPCYSTVYAGNHIPYNFPDLSEGNNTHGLYGCN